MVWKQTFPNTKQIGRTVFRVTVNPCEISKNFLSSSQINLKVRKMIGQNHSKVWEFCQFSSEAKTCSFHPNIK